MFGFSLRYRILLLLGDFAALVAAFVGAYLVRVRIDDRPLADQVPGEEYVRIFLLLLPFWIIIFATLNLYKQEVYEKPFSELSRLLVGSFIGILFVIGYDFISDQPIFPARLVPIYGFLGGFALLLTERTFLRNLRSTMFRYGYGINRVMLIGSAEETHTLATLLGDTNTSGYKIVAIIGPKSLLPKNNSDVLQFGSLEAGLAAAPDLYVHTIIQTEFYDSPQRNQHILKTVQDNHMSYRFIPAHGEFYSGKNTVDLFHGIPVVTVHQTALVGWGRITKRIFDIFGAIIGLIVSLPVFIVIGLIIKATDPKGPIFYKHRRYSRFGTEIDTLKLRSFYWKYSTGSSTKKTDEEVFKEMGREDLIEEFQRDRKVKKDPRVMPIGRFTRATSIDELPQLWNVLVGDLSLVGPRPMVKDEFKLYKGHLNRVLSVKSGITGLWQVSGRSDLSFDERVDLDLYYVQNWSFWLDIKILLKTILVVLQKSGAR